MAVAAFLLAPLASANTTTVQFTLTGSGNIVDNGVYVGPYTGQITGGSSVQIICDNYTTPVHVGLRWNAAQITFADPTFANDVKFNDNINSQTGQYNDLNVPKTDSKSQAAAIVLQDYEAAAWLAQQIQSDYNGITKSNQAVMDTNIGNLTYALLAVFDPSLTSPVSKSGGFDTAAQADYNAALQGKYIISEFSNVEFWTPDPTNASQEYITVTPTPESASFLLFGTGLLFIAGILRRKQLA
jgi:hypothetical protein